jgi:hypothetical protein
MKPRKTPPTRGLVAVVWHALFAFFFPCRRVGLESTLRAAVAGEKWAVDECWKIMEPLLLEWKGTSPIRARNTECPTLQKSRNGHGLNEGMPSCGQEIPEDQTPPENT